MPVRKVEIGDGLLEQVEGWQAEHKIRSRGKAVAALIEKGLQLAAAEGSGFSLEDAMRRQWPGIILQR